MNPCVWSLVLLNSVIVVYLWKKLNSFTFWVRSPKIIKSRERELFISYRELINSYREPLKKPTVPVHMSSALIAADFLRSSSRLSSYFCKSGSPASRAVASYCFLSTFLHQHWLAIHKIISDTPDVNNIFLTSIC